LNVGALRAQGGAPKRSAAAAIQALVDRHNAGRAIQEVHAMLRILRHMVVALLVVGGVTMFGASIDAEQGHTTKRFSGAKVNAGTVTHLKKNGADVLRLSADFVVPDTPDPHWQVVDSSGRVYLLQRLGIKGDKVNTEITLPSYIKDIAKVQIYCAWAEALLGETTFESTLTLE
jgi:hypothetical protein